jgi:phosphatidylglycerophosphatase A
MAEFIAMGAGTGRGPVAPATWATAFILLLYWALNVESPSAGYFSVLVLIIVAGTWAANRLSVPDDPDPGRVVIDEWAGALVTVAFLPTTAGWMLAGFFVFRVLDILKPWPIRKFEDLHGGVGIMADDIAAGVVGAIGLNVVRVAFF